MKSQAGPRPWGGVLNCEKDWSAPARRPLPAGAIPLLHNMSVPPRTQVRWRIDPLGERVVHIDLQATGRSLDWVRSHEAELREPLLRDWNRLALRGALLVYSGRPAAETPGESLVVRDLGLVLNVLGRASSHVLLPDAPLALEDAFLDRTLATDDPRLVRLALERGAVPEETK